MSHEKNPNIKISTLLDIMMLGHIDLLKKVIEQCKERKLTLDLNEQDKGGNFVTILAAELNNLELLTYFVENGAAASLNPEFKDGAGRNVIGWANKHRNTKMIEYIEQVNQKFKKSSLPSSQVLAKFGEEVMGQFEKHGSSKPQHAGKSSSMPSISTPAIKIKGH